jgi:predicted O-methyltransferase YrrM
VSPWRKLGKRVGLHLPFVGAAIRERDDLRAEVGRQRARLAAIEDGDWVSKFAPPGHFYSPIPSLADLRRDEGRLFGDWPRELPGIDLNESGQLALLERCKRYYAEQPFSALRTSPRRYYFENGMYDYSDAVLLYCMMRHLQPRRIVEVGSGFSSCAMLDVNELFFGNAIALTLIEPHPGALRSLTRSGDLERVRLVERRLQDVDVSVFDELDERDVLFVDSTHVAKIGSDVNFLFADILPRLRPGTYVHFHDVFYPFEYPRGWVYEGRVWSEAYVLRSFLAFNATYEIVLFNTFLQHFHRDVFERDLPLCLKGGAGSIWLRRRQ